MEMIRKKELQTTLLEKEWGGMGMIRKKELQTTLLEKKGVRGTGDGVDPEEGTANDLPRIKVARSDGRRRGWGWG